MHKFQSNVRSLSWEESKWWKAGWIKNSVYIPNSRTITNMTLAFFDSTFTALKEAFVALQSVQPVGLLTAFVIDSIQYVTHTQ